MRNEALKFVRDGQSLQGELLTVLAPAFLDSMIVIQRGPCHIPPLRFVRSLHLNEKWAQVILELFDDLCVLVSFLWNTSRTLGNLSNLREPHSLVIEEDNTDTSLLCVRSDARFQIFARLEAFDFPLILRHNHLFFGREVKLFAPNPAKPFDTLPATDLEIACGDALTCDDFVRHEPLALLRLQRMSPLQWRRDSIRKKRALRLDRRCWFTATIKGCNLKLLPLEHVFLFTTPVHLRLHKSFLHLLLLLLLV